MCSEPHNDYSTADNDHHTVYHKHSTAHNHHTSYYDVNRYLVETRSWQSGMAVAN